MNRIIQGTEIGPVRMSKLDGWREIVRNEEKLVGQVRLLQRTFRFAMVIPSWSNFLSTRYARDMSQLLDPDMIRKFRAWWELMLECGDVERPEGRQQFGFCRLILLSEAMMKRHNRHIQLYPKRYGISNERAGQLVEYVRSNYEALTLH